MESAFTFITLLSMILIASTVDGRPDPALEAIMKDGSMPRTAVDDHRPRPETTDIQGLPRKQGTSVLHIPNKNAAECHTTAEARKRDEKRFVKDFQPRPNLSAYDDEKLTHDKPSTDDFEPRPNISAYDNNDVHPEEDVHDFEPRPNISVYDNGTVGLKKEKGKADDDFEPRPNVSVYDD